MPPSPAALTPWQAWYLATRPRTLTATFVPLGLAAAAALAHGKFDGVAFALALVGALFLQIASNLINEYVDHVRGSDALKQAGQGMTIKGGILTPRQVLISAIATVLIGAAIGLYLVTQSGLLLLWIGMGGVLVVITYTAGPFPLAYNGLGEVAVGIFMGPLMVLGGYYVQARAFDWLPILVSLPIALTVAAILHANNIRDLDADRAANKRTLAVLLGLPAARVEYVLLVGGGYGALLALVLFGVLPFTTLIAFITLPTALNLIHTIRTSNDVQQLHAAQGRTAQLHGMFGLLIVVGWLIALAGVWVLSQPFS
jgi:1,4-dihydroxy-2-naphthoate polyprenyltransferase